MDKIMFLCDGEKPDCSKTICYQNGGKCYHTQDIEHAKNFRRHREGSEIVWEGSSPSLEKQQEAWYVPDASELELLP